MVRPLRPDYTNTYHHVVIRGIDGLPIFGSSQKRDQFLGYLKDSRTTYDLRLYAFGFMDNHWHAFVRRAGSSMARYFQAVKSRYTIWYNKVHDRTGTLYDDRYFSSIIEADSYFKMVWTYVQTQGVKAGIYKRPEEDPGSTAGLYLNGDDRYDWIDWEEALEHLGVPIEGLDASTLQLGQQSEELPVRRERDQQFIASDEYIEKYMQIRKETVRESPRKESPLEWDTLLRGMQIISGYSPEEILQPSKVREHHRVRAGLAYACRRYGHQSTAEIADRLGVTDATVSRMIKKVVKQTPEIQKEWDVWAQNRNF